MRSRRLPLCAAFAAFALHLPFVVRYDLHFQPDFAISMLMSRAIALEGERPVFFWGQAYLGTYGCYLTAVLFRLLGVSVPLAGVVSLGIWACGVGFATALAERLLGARAAWWAAAAGAIASPYANHYVTQPYTSYETAPVLSILAIGGLAWATRLIATPLGRRSAGSWFTLGLLLGFGWWTTRLFLPSLIAVLLAAALVARWRDVPLRRLAAGGALVVVAAVLGDSPEILYRFGNSPGPERVPSFAIASTDTVLENVRQAVASLPAYLNGDPRARLPEGVTFAQRISELLEAYADEALAPGAIASALDVFVRIALAGIMLVAGGTAVRAYREGSAPLLALSLVPFVTLVAISLSAETAGEYFLARRYWFGILLVLPILFASTVVQADRSRIAAVGLGARMLAALLLLYSAVAQARMLVLPDELTDYRVLVRDLTANGERTVVMASWNAWVVAALGDGRLETVARYNNRRPEIVDRVARRDRIAFVVPADSDFPPAVHVRDARFLPASEDPRSVGPWRWRGYLRAQP